jgi:hypothetical protein
MRCVVVVLGHVDVVFVVEAAVTDDDDKKQEEEDDYGDVRIL